MLGLLDSPISLCYITRRLTPNPASLSSRRRRCALTKSRTELMVDRLRDMQVSSPDIEASAVVSVDGLPIATALPREVEEDRVSAMSAAMLSLGERIASELGRGNLSEVQIKGEKGFVILQSLG